MLPKIVDQSFLLCVAIEMFASGRHSIVARSLIQCLQITLQFLSHRGVVGLSGPYATIYGSFCMERICIFPNVL
ncbi:hypothetical protein NY2A_b476R [Paramecium bursaria Chlorella virus NY2A]|uniref:Uncharacterized protein b476R n=1 Tax=Paramecium bursaria Chlorella virus NY2A TaxID=46021 RepID=A7IX01_PBCVN|nr:hypothetical protein NY2A_b476R [Paramecium bursaria Chlorella virus NY2A]YP_001498503.1 hypothetical protein AR158_c422R [Paramecium bursaria Chlorella virus AR158]ABT14875.1 hypothetical protein NY2A_b476R [Paramecium bursaria Chlorella virus NY2A]ABU43967.1 hypothetical protein AR158_c422R [Paramecium bursaria Chlorella virus AR158]